MENFRKFMKLLKHDPKKPKNSFWMHLIMLRLVGLWGPDNLHWSRIYWRYNTFCFIFWVLFFFITQCLFFMSVTSVSEVADALFFFLNELMLLPKLYYYRKNNDRLKNVVKKLDTKHFLPRNKDEEKFVHTAMKRTTYYHRFLLFGCYYTILTWIVSAYLGHKNHTGKIFLIPAKFPFDTDKSIGWWFAYFYQIFAIFYTGTTHMTTDSMATGMVFHAASQVEILGNRISKLGHEQVNDVMKTKSKDVKQRKYYKELLSHIMHHKEILEYCKELQDIFKETLFVQLISTCFIVCMTELQMVIAIKESFVLFINSFPYFFMLQYQIYILCKTGNELTYASKPLVYNAFCSNFMEFDKRTKQTLLFFMQRVKRDIKIDAQAIFTITLNIENYIAIMRASYSYFALLQTMQ